MKRKILKNVVIIAIIALASFLRLWKLNSYPALNADEAAIGYNAYSLIQTGKDEHGNPWPIHFQSFNDYKPGFYEYLVLPFVRLLGLNEWAVRLPNALLAIASVYLIYYLSNYLFKDRNFEIWNLKFGIWPALLLAINPWHIHFSRGGWEVNTSTFFILLGLVLFVKGLRKSLIHLVLAAFSFALSLYTYHSARVIVPLFGFGLIIIFNQEVKKDIKNFLVAGIIFIICLLPLIKEFSDPQVLSRAGGVGLFADTGPLERINEQRMEHGDFEGLPAVIMHNKPVNYSLAYVENWAEHFHGEFLFLSGDDVQRNKVPETGQMYIWEVATILLGLVFMIKFYPLNSKFYSLMLWWLIIAPSAAALTFQSPHGLRAQNMVIPLTLISGLGMFALIKYFAEKKNYLSYGVLIVFVVVVWSFARYQHMYWVHMAKEYPYSSQYGLKELVGYISENDNKFDKVLVTDKYDQPYILFLFYLNYPPELFQQNHQLLGRDKYGFSTVNQFGKYYFKSIDWDIDKTLFPNSLIVGALEEIPDETNIVKRVNVNGFEYFKVVAN